MSDIILKQDRILISKKACSDVLVDKKGKYFTLTVVPKTNPSLKKLTFEMDSDEMKIKASIEPK